MNFLIGCSEKQPIRKLGKRLRSYEKENRSLIPVYQHTVDTPVCLPPRRRSQPSSLKSWHYKEKLDLTLTHGT